MSHWYKKNYRKIVQIEHWKDSMEQLLAVDDTSNNLCVIFELRFDDQNSTDDCDKQCKCQ